MWPWKSEKSRFLTVFSLNRLERDVNSKNKVAHVTFVAHTFLTKKEFLKSVENFYLFEHLNIFTQRFFAHCVSRRCVRHTIHSSFCAYFYALSIELNLYHSIFGSFCVRSENRFTQILAKFEALWRPYCFIIFNFFFLFRSGHVYFISVPILV